MKKIKIALIVLLLLLAFAVTVSAEELYDEQYSALDTEEIYNSLPEKAKEFLSGLDIDFSSSDWYSSFTYKSVFERIGDMFKGSLKNPIKGCSAAIAILLISAAVLTLAGDKEDMSSAVNIISVLGVCVSLLLPVVSLIATCISTLKASSAFMLLFIPCFLGVLMLSGGTAISATSSGMLIAAAELVGSTVAFILSPAIAACMMLGISSSFSPLEGTEKAGEVLKKSVIWGLSTVAALFSAVLSVGAALGSATDKLTLKTAKIFTSSVVPVVGGALSESLSAVALSFSLLKTSVGLIGIVCLAAIFLPLIIEILAWKLSVFAVELVSGLLGLNRVTIAVKSVATGLTVMLASSLVICMLFIVSLAVLMKFGGAV